MLTSPIFKRWRLSQWITRILVLAFPNEKYEQRIRVLRSKDTPIPSFPPYSHQNKTSEFSIISHGAHKSDSCYRSHGLRAPIALTLSSKNNPSLRYLYLNQRRYYFVWLYKVLEIYIFIILWIPVLYKLNHPYYPNWNQGIELFVVSIIAIVTGIDDFRWRVF